MFLEASASLPLNEDNSREVIVFAEIHAATLEAVVQWANSLGRGFVPVALGNHASALPTQVHAIAVKLTNHPPNARACFFTLDEANFGKPLLGEGYRDAQKLWVESPKQVIRILHFTAVDCVGSCFFWATPNPAFPDLAAGMRSQGGKPYLLVPCHRPDPMFTVSHWYGDRGRTRWQVETGLSRNDLARFATDTQAKPAGTGRR